MSFNKIVCLGSTIFTVFYLSSCKTTPQTELNIASQEYKGAKEKWSVFQSDFDTPTSESSKLFETSNFSTDIKLKKTDDILYKANTTATAIAVLSSGNEAFRAKIQALKAAKHSIRIQALVFKGDESGLAIATILKEKYTQFFIKVYSALVKANKEKSKNEQASQKTMTRKAMAIVSGRIRVIVDQVSNISLDDSGHQTRAMYYDLRSHGIPVHGYEYGLNSTVAELCTNPWKFCVNQRYHDKMWIIDGLKQTGVAIVGGLNIANEYFQVNPISTPQSSNWSDQDVVVKGDIVNDIVRVFDRNYNRQGQNISWMTKLVSQFLDKSWDATAAVKTNIEKFFDISRNSIDKQIIGNFKVNKQITGLIKTTLAKRNLSLEYRPVLARFFQSRPRIKETYIEQAYLKSIEDAKDSIQINNAYFIPSKKTIGALKEAAERGVDIEIITNSPQSNDLKLMSYVSRTKYNPILNFKKNNRGGSINIFEWHGFTTYSKENVDVDTAETLHSKYAVFDKELSIVGSYNLDPRSRKHNSETAVVYYQKDLSKKLSELFAQQTAKSRKITIEDADGFLDPQDAEIKNQLAIGLKAETLL